MLNNAAVSEVATKVAKRFAALELERVITEPVIDSEGEEALRITLVVKPDVAQRLNGDTTLDILVRLQQELQKDGEDRLPIVEYATEQELNSEDAEEEVGRAESAEDDDGIKIKDA